MPPSRDSESSSDSSDSESCAASRRPRRRSWSKQPFSDQPRFRLSTCPGQVRCRRGGVCLFRHRTAHKARRRTRATTSCRGGCRGLAESLFESLGARGGSQSPAHARETGPQRLATRRGGTRPTGAQYFSARGESVHGFPAHTLLSALPLCEVGAARAARWRILLFHVRIGPQKLNQYEFRLAPADERVWNCHVYNKATQGNPIRGTAAVKNTPRPRISHFSGAKPGFPGAKVQLPLHLCPWKSRVSRGRAPF